ncbi:hypothetical protein ACFYUD_26960 [Nocardia tengchongensis]|uniref:hypothetical protein n=1 Tax=Nocardia tengchongensis TaxID=2055889 RepID=UPI0036C90296
MARPVLAAQVGRSVEWLKALENGRIQRAPSLELFLRIARVLDLDDLATLTGDEHAVPVTVFAGEPRGSHRCAGRPDRLPHQVQRSAGRHRASR